MTDLTQIGKIFRYLQYYWGDLTLFLIGIMKYLLSFLFLHIKVWYLSIMLRTVKNLIVRYALCIENFSIISEDETVNNVRYNAHCFAKFKVTWEFAAKQ